MAEPALAVRDLTVVRGERRVLDRVSLRAEHGEVLALLGPNGAGKTTLLRAAAGLLPFTGSVRIDGHDACALSARARAMRLSLVPQQTGLRSALSAHEVVAQGRYAHARALFRLGSEDRAAIERALATTDVAQFAARPFTALSHGEQRRVLIARALCTGARILCLDEPTAGLDVEHALRLHALLRQLASQGCAVVVVLHQLEDALRNADRALLLSGGVVVRSDRTRDVIEPATVREIYRVEMRQGSAVGFYLPGDPT
jgi:iron complex transport system ATP-binding protein